MDIVNQPDLLKNYIDRYKIHENFTADNLHFRLFHYSKGEYLVSPLKSLEHILFLVDGEVQIYGISTDTSFSPIALSHAPSLFGDLEFATGESSLFYAEAQNEVYCIAISLPLEQEKLRQDIRFLNTILKSIGKKLSLFSVMEANGKNLEERVRYYMEHFCEHGTLRGINNAMMQLHCSRRQLQRVLSKMCKTGEIIKIKKGVYQRQQ